MGKAKGNSKLVKFFIVKDLSENLYTLFHNTGSEYSVVGGRLSTVGCISSVCIMRDTGTVHTTAHSAHCMKGTKKILKRF